MLSLSILLISIIVFIALAHWLTKDEVFEKLPGPKGIYFLRNAVDLLLDSVPLFYFIRSLSNRFKDKFKLQLGPEKFLLIHNPEDVEIIVSGSRFNRKGAIYKFIKPWLQEGLLLSYGPKWQQRRKILTPAFHFNILRYFSTMLMENSNILVKNLESEVGKEKTDVGSFITDFTLNSICETSMGVKLDPATSEFGRKYKNGIHDLGQTAVHRCQRFWMYPDMIFDITSVGRKQKKLLHLLSSFRDSVINKRRASYNSNNSVKDLIQDDENSNEVIDYGKKKLALLDLLLEAEKDNIIDAQGTAEEVDTFMFEGHDTTAAALTFAVMTLANNPEAQDKVYAECKEIFGESDRDATMNDLPQLKYLECCIKEALRLYPPVSFILRKIDKDVQLKDGVLPAGVDLAILIYDLHRRDDQFVEPLKFRPERFLGEPTWHPYAYLPFSIGPRNCIGQKFAMMEMKYSLSAIIRRYRLLPVTKPQDVIFITDFILRTRDPIYVKFEDRVRST